MLNTQSFRLKLKLYLHFSTSDWMYFIIQLLTVWTHGMMLRVLSSLSVSSPDSWPPCQPSSPALSSSRSSLPSYRYVTRWYCCPSPWRWLAHPWGWLTPSPTCSWWSCTRRTPQSSCRSVEMWEGREPTAANMCVFCTVCWRGSSCGCHCECTCWPIQNV